jgi:hypothetical protein
VAGGRSSRFLRAPCLDFGDVVLAQTKLGRRGVLSRLFRVRTPTIAPVTAG